MIRTLAPGEPVPADAPRRFRNDAGYVRLRWKVGPDSYVEEYEHRVVMGRPAGMEVHHLDHDKANNDPANLLVLTPREHTLLHIALDRAAGKFTGRIAAREKAERKAAREAEWANRAAMYQAGMSTVEIGERVGLDPSNVYRGLKSRGVAMRSPAEGARLALARGRRAA